MKHAKHLETFRAWRQALTIVIEDLQAMNETNDLLAAVAALTVAVEAAMKVLAGSAHTPAVIEGQVNVINSLAAKLTAATATAPAPAATVDATAPAAA